MRVRRSVQQFAEALEQTLREYGRRGWAHATVHRDLLFAHLLTELNGVIRDRFETVQCGDCSDSELCMSCWAKMEAGLLDVACNAMLLWDAIAPAEGGE